MLSFLQFIFRNASASSGLACFFPGVAERVRNTADGKFVEVCMYISPCLPVLYKCSCTHKDRRAKLYLDVYRVALFADVGHVLHPVRRHLAAVHQPVLAVPVELHERPESLRLRRI